MKREYKICLMGCDDWTEFTVELTEDEANLLRRVSELSHKTSTYGCMPIMDIDEVGE